jgi:hypothetical protein
MVWTRMQTYGTYRSSIRIAQVLLRMLGVYSPRSALETARRGVLLIFNSVQKFLDARHGLQGIPESTEGKGVVRFDLVWNMIAD